VLRTRGLGAPCRFTRSSPQSSPRGRSTPAHIAPDVIVVVVVVTAVIVVLVPVRVRAAVVVVLVLVAVVAYVLVPRRNEQLSSTRAPPAG